MERLTQKREKLINDSGLTGVEKIVYEKGVKDGIELVLNDILEFMIKDMENKGEDTGLLKAARKILL